MLNVLPHKGAWINVQAESKEAGRRVCQELCTQIAMSRPYNYLNVSGKTAAEALEAIACAGWCETAIDLGDATRFWFDDETMAIFNVAIREGGLILNHSPQRTVFDDVYSSICKRESVEASKYLSMRDRLYKYAQKFAAEHPHMVEQVGSDIEIQFKDWGVVGLYEDEGEGGVYVRGFSGPTDAMLVMSGWLDKNNR